jgi:hypothetical protein
VISHRQVWHAVAGMQPFLYGQRFFRSGPAHRTTRCTARHAANLLESAGGDLFAAYHDRKLAGCTGLEFSRGEIANRATTHANSLIRPKARQVGRKRDVGIVPRATPQFRRGLGDILETVSGQASRDDPRLERKAGVTDRNRGVAEGSRSVVFPRPRSPVRIRRFRSKLLMGGGPPITEGNAQGGGAAGTREASPA